MYKLIASDLDETLLNDNHKVCEENIKAIRKASEKGIKFVPATGRGFMAIQSVVESLGLDQQPDEYVISMNGGILTENKDNRIIDFQGLSYEKADEIFCYGLTKDVCIHVYTTDQVYVYNLNEDERNRFVNQNNAYIELAQPDLSFLKDERIAKVLYQNLDVPYLMSLEPGMESMTAGEISVSYSSGRYMEFNCKGVTKGKAILALGEKLGIKPEEIIAVGDNYNDMSMFEVAGLSIAAGNAVDGIKEVCDYVCKNDNNEGVLAEVIDYIGIER